MLEGRRAIVASATVVIGVLSVAAATNFGQSPAAAHQQGPKLHLSDAPPDQQVVALTYCNAIYRVITKEGTPVEYGEFDLRFKTDSGPDGPAPGTPVLINAGMRDDRGFVIFFAPGEISGFIKSKC